MKTFDRTKTFESRFYVFWLSWFKSTPFETYLLETFLDICERRTISRYLLPATLSQVDDIREVFIITQRWSYDAGPSTFELAKRVCKILDSKY